MTKYLAAFASTFLLVEILAVTSATAIWAILSELHFDTPFILGAEAVCALGIAVVAVAIYRRALAAENRMVPAKIDETA